MAYVYCYAPLSGTVWGKATYCGGGTHTVVSCIGGTQPIDIGAGFNTTLKLYVSSSILKIKVTQCNGVCADTSLVPWTYGLKVQLYKDSAATQVVGTIGLGHVRNRKANGTYTPTWGMTLGYLPSSDCACGCSSGSHLHMQGTGYQNPIEQCAGKTVTAGGTYIYRWTI